ncbi:MAG: sigma-70 family RNA polymerase sigma factor [Verrucomicrobia bacterium]|nr:MAG: sigma-70 family RNA polymerase sigma factor [Verrucomicrobiota bacterium]
MPEHTEPSGTSSAASGRLAGLFAELEGPLLRYARRLAGDNGTAEDLVQEAFLRLAPRLAQVREPRRWLFTTVHNLALNHHRQATRTAPLETAGAPAGGGPVPVETAPGPDQALARWEEVQRLRRCLDRIEPRQREILRLRFQEDCSYREIAERTGLTVGHVGYLLHHAVKALAAAMSAPE